MKGDRSLQQTHTFVSLLHRICRVFFVLCFLTARTDGLFGVLCCVPKSLNNSLCVWLHKSTISTGGNATVSV